AQHELGDPEVAAADHAADREALPVRLDPAALLDVAPAANALARLRIIEHGVLAIDVMLDLEVAGVGGRPMTLQRRAYGSIVHRHLLPIFACACSPRNRVSAFVARENRFTLFRIMHP